MGSIDLKKRIITVLITSPIVGYIYMVSTPINMGSSILAEDFLSLLNLAFYFTIGIVIPLMFLLGIPISILTDIITNKIKPNYIRMIIRLILYNLLGTLSIIIFFKVIGQNISVSNLFHSSIALITILPSTCFWLVLTIIRTKKIKLI